MNSRPVTGGFPFAATWRFVPPGNNRAPKNLKELKD
jgi:hypothetical protein